ncbi:MULTISPECIES: helix-turn-helix domain-containing protein [unclassified Nocardiopsis]|uniref:helix-turn-helix domain-containing protein n=1 Tax=Nocardiopsis TaxID=2013 RepID=UPI00387B3FC6
MIVRDLVEDRELGIAVKWAPDSFLDNEITGVVTTDLADPSPYLEPGGVLLTGLVWWRRGDPDTAMADYADRLVRSGISALLAGEAAHGPTPEALVAACRDRGLALLAVPRSTGFHTVSAFVHRTLAESEPGARPLGARERRTLTALVSEGAGTAALLDGVRTALAASYCEIATDAGRTTASGVPDPGALRAVRPVPVPGSSPVDTWWLRVVSDRPVPPRALAEAAGIVSLERARVEAGREGARRAADRLAELLHRPWADRAAVESALAACGLAGARPLTVVAARIRGDRTGVEWARSALEEALRADDREPVVGRTPDGRAVAVVPGEAAELPEALRRTWALFVTLLSGRGTPYAGVGEPVADPEELASCLVRAGYALDAAEAGAGRDGVLAAAELRGLAGLVAGVAPAVRRDYHRRVLGPVLDHDGRTGGDLLHTLRVFLDENGSWVRTARLLHVHVNTVHYRIPRIETLTGRDLSDLDHRLDLRAALLCS